MLSHILLLILVQCITLILQPWEQPGRRSDLTTVEKLADLEERTVNTSLSHLSQGCSRWQDGEMHGIAPDGAGQVELEVSHGQEWFPHKWAEIMFSRGNTSSGWEQG